MKRKRTGGLSKPQRLLAAKQERYDKLSYLAKKHLTKQAKLVKTFLLQKKIRKLKTFQDEQTPSNEPTATDDHAVPTKESSHPSLQRQKLEEQVNKIKDLPLDLVVEQASRQLGLLHANPNPDADFSIPVSMPKDDLDRQEQQIALVSTILDHKRFQSTLEEWNEKVADFRRFCLRLDERDDKFSQDTPVISLTQQKKRKGKQQQTTEDADPTSLFCTLNGEDDEVDWGDNMMAYGPAAALMEEPQKKKNRQGQRARKAKAMALQAKKMGRQYESLNWRSAEEKQEKQRKQYREKAAAAAAKRKNTGSDGNKKQNSAQNEKAKANSVPEKEHPSWAAKQQQKTGIVAFQGTKITFD